MPAGVPDCDGVDFDPPHPAIMSRATRENAASGRSRDTTRWRCCGASQRDASINARTQTTPDPPSNGMVYAAAIDDAAPRAVVVTLTANGTADDPLKLIEDGLGVQVAPCSAPEHASVTVPLNPPAGVSDKL